LKAHWPALFHQIIRNDTERTTLCGQQTVAFGEFKRLREERQRYRIAAQALLKWNPNPAGGPR
jgi:hypothetical protein